MSRWRPPGPKSSPYVTAESYRTLETELKQLWERRKDVTIALSAAAAEGDRSENAEYQYRKKELREIDRRIHYLQKRLPSLTVVSEKPAKQDQVFFGAWVTLETMDGTEITYRIVGADEIDTTGGLISLDSPLAKGLLKKMLDDEVAIRHADQETRYYITAIRY
ncbi:transcription elongation factor GreB [Methylomonas albis]|uniref:Transcription elongation factor GreB n=1 Tax=Methylomonas albis TaxID=1854563 RepID=A0ABR9D0K7_9GAMM|nr:transcription elongation factor GreB [Methylomonas albis]MBD9356652.1 transcription elongation factor GreB [Methylomonas albis]